jgi:hypothetical protein
MERLPLTILLGLTEEVVLWEGDVIAGLTDFTLDADMLVRATYTVRGNCFPRRSGNRIREPGKFPLHIHVGDDVNEIVIAYEGRPFGLLRNLYVALKATEKRILRITTYALLPDELNTALLDLGTEVIVQPPDDPPSTGGVDASL